MQCFEWRLYQHCVHNKVIDRVNILREAEHLRTTIYSDHKTLKKMRLGQQQKWYLEFRNNFDLREFDEEERQSICEKLLNKSTKCCCHVNGNPFQQTDEDEDVKTEDTDDEIIDL
ncbi:Oidioi.mRNA.OKI2018_I69.chr1.g3714.t1.cds [Oikopleura dioica]|uniref:Oidioi.mRNA.OKI2018_I69.chr1.g3714.t1.cds n=1 Tax=Oikopleura dioica TaxID=34765 RepID=A0ABN7SYZ2_OIKDI|nr:Oidioi.mRNA.OKI2018_I69.chr1.g3714.t1.cds [Oikopleura dioica]